VALSTKSAPGLGGRKLPMEVPKKIVIKRGNITWEMQDGSKGEAEMDAGKVAQWWRELGT